ncbi:glycosyltransferase family 2 protein [Oceanimonas sp. CHS3-5]|uniref:glycosyltransferase family 2 protein n=1 Tax=Oceanimonas sp. CHS3-5 TaxID=3068186 RepID=UPI00273D2DB8|nr:glycosyltransferase family 2 protein [Oceanimonas sp. CHS3-5]MDP5291624.1 glycosyltransferase family 2 protein [Oceanimonas sp. CHS3-5]
MPRISVLIPSYKPEAYVEHCLESIEQQTLSKSLFTVYIALNGPKEKFESFLTGLLGSYSFNFRYYYLPEPSVSSARNFLIDNSGEEFLTFIDDDDCITPNYLKSLLDVSDDDVLGVGNVFNFNTNPSERKESYIGKAFLNVNDVENLNFKSRKFFSSACGKLIHRSMIDGVRFDNNLAVGEDSLFMAKISRNVRAIRKVRTDACYLVFERKGSATRKEINKIDEMNRIIYLLKAYCSMLLKKDYDKVFVLTRVAATLMHGRRLLRW